MPEQAGLVDVRGEPLRRSRADLERPIAVPTLTGIHQVFSGAVFTGGLDPERLGSLLQQADAGEAEAYLSLAIEMERREPVYRSVLGTRKRAVTRLPVTVESATDAAADVALADEIRSLIRAPGFSRARGDLLDGLGKGFAAVEVAWDTRRAPWVPRDRVDFKTGARLRGYQWIDPRWFRYDRLSGRELRLLTDTDQLDGMALPPYRYIIHEPYLMSGLPLWGGLARVAAVAYMAKSFSLGDWLRFAATYGMPLRLGKYGVAAKEEDIAVLARAVANLGTDWGAVVPDSMIIELLQAAGSSGTGGAEVFRALANWADEALCILVLGQTASTKGTPGSLGNDQARADVREDIRDADAADLAETLNRDLVGAYLALNHGAMDPDAAPRIVIAEPDAEDITALTDSLKALVPLGMRVGASVVRDRLGWPDPEDGEEVLGAAAEPEPEPDPDAPPPRPPPALNRAAGPAAADVPDVPDVDPAVLARLSAQGQAALGGMLDQVRAMLAAAGSMEEAAAMIEAAYPRLDAGPLAAALAEARAVAHLAGRADVVDEAAAT
jgi:phage gp29-like protein